MKRIAVATVTFVALLAILVAAMPFVVPGELLRTVVAAQISSWTGRTVTIAGEPHLSVYPDLAISVDGVTVSNPDGVNDEAFVTADSVRASMRILPLLVGRAEFDEFELIRPRFRLIVGTDGGTNWRMAAGAIADQVARAVRRDDAGDAPATNGNGEGAVNDMRIGRLLVTDGIILYDDLASDHREEMTDVDFDFTWASVAAAASGSGSLQWRGERVEFNGTLSDPMALLAGGSSATRFAIATTILRASFTGEARTNGQLQLDGHASATTPSLRRLIAWTGTPMDPGSILGTASIEGPARWIGPAISFEAAKVELDGNRAEGTLSVVFSEDRPALRGTLATERLDLSPYFEASRASITGEGSWLLAPTSLTFASAVDADVEIDAGQVLIGAVRLGSVAAGITIRDGAIDIDAKRGQFYGGNIVARIGAGMVGDDLVAGAEVEMSGVPARVALTDLAGIDAIDGTATFSLSLRSRGATWGEFARALAGTGGIGIRRGKLTGLDLVETAAIMADPLAEPMQPLGGVTEFSSLNATVDIANGGIGTDNLTMKGGGFSLDVSGKGSIINGAIEGTANLVSGTDRIPLKITGRWRAPVVARDTAAVAPAEQVTTGDRPDSATGG